MPDELTKSQGFHGHPYFGGSLDGFGIGAHLPTYKSDAGVTLLPQAAALRGSGAAEGRNAYDANVYSYGGFDRLGYLAGTFNTYRIMRQHPTIALARATIMGPIAAAGCSYHEVKGKAPKGARDLIAEWFEPIRMATVLSMLRVLDYGYQLHEVVWDANDDGARVPAKLKELRHEWNTFTANDKGEVTGVNNQSADVPMGRLLHLAIDAEYGNPYGRSRLENVRRTWCNYNATEDQRFRLAQKAAGIVTHIGYPPDVKTVGADGLKNYDKAVSMARALAQGQSIVYPSTGGLQVDDIKDAIDLAKGSLFPIQLLDMGDTGSATSALDGTLKYLDQMLCRGMLRSERSVIEATGGGTRAESADHTANISDTDCDMLHEEIVNAINTQLVDQILVENYGPKAKGTVRIKANELVDENALIDGKLLDALLANQMTMGEVFARIDMEAWCERMGIHLRADHEPWPEEMPGGEGEEPDEDERDEAA